MRVLRFFHFIFLIVTVAAAAVADVVDLAFVVPEASFERYQVQYKDTFSIRCNAR